MKNRILTSLIALSLTATLAYAQENADHGDKAGPCKEIKEACEKAGFEKNKAKEGYGLWVDCVRPIVNGTAQPKKATKPLPSVSAELVTACKAKHPHIGEKHEGKRK